MTAKQIRETETFQKCIIPLVDELYQLDKAFFATPSAKRRPLLASVNKCLNALNSYLCAINEFGNTKVVLAGTGSTGDGGFSIYKANQRTNNTIYQIKV
ncbi:MAG: hypothetical protein FWD49_05220 [Firmicutes bacterium]|nr:hypothetical protein [Bacillota bacterium]